MSGLSIKRRRLAMLGVLTVGAASGGCAEDDLRSTNQSMSESIRNPLDRAFTGVLTLPVPPLESLVSQSGSKYEAPSSPVEAEPIAQPDPDSDLPDDDVPDDL